VAGLTAGALKLVVEQKACGVQHASGAQTPDASRDLVVLADLPGGNGVAVVPGIQPVPFGLVVGGEPCEVI
jgi:hypothetical protein